jgi:hypothetical protein
LTKTSSRPGTAANRLARESSPYLLLHATNPVDWYAWGDEALGRAREEDKPIFLSVGYSTCYWCHVMERECFSDPEIARQMNDAFVCIKVDREERPDLDEIYMAATQLLTRSGGWPNSVFLTPELKPFFAGTYFPPRDASGRPGFPRVLQSLREAWALRRAEVRAQAQAVTEAMSQHLAASHEAFGPLDPAGPEATQRALSGRYDRVHGGFGRAPKFPSPSNLFFLLDRATDDPEAREMLVATLDRMARGGLHDQLAGGFHRYSVDARWLVPHFEKMLYDNGALASLYAGAHALAPDLGFARVARAILDFVGAEMTGPHGGFLSAIDAETDGEEGAYYTWTREELEAHLGPEDARFLAPLWGFDGPPNFEHTRYVLHLPKPLPEAASDLSLSEDALLARLERGRRALLDARAKRERPLVDDKVLADWNGLMIAGFADAARHLKDPALLEPARRAARFVLENLVEGGELRHAWREGRGRVLAFLDDYAFLVQGLLALHAATREDRWREDALRLLAEQEERLGDPSGGYFAAGETPDLLFRAKPAFDGAVASGNGIAALNLLALHRATGEASYRSRAEATLAAFGRDLGQAPLAHVTLVRAQAALDLGAPVVAASGAGTARAETGAAVGTTREAPPSAALADLEDEAREVVEVVGRLGPGHAEERDFSVEVAVRRGFHLYANPSGAENLVATSLTAVLGRLVEVRYPEGEAGADGLRVYRGRFRLEGRLAMPRSGAPLVELTYQACDERRCLPVTARLVRL